MYHQVLLEINISKKRNILINFTKRPLTPTHTIIKDIIKAYRYLGTVIDDKLQWEDDTIAIHSRAQQRLFLLRTLNSFKLMTLSYRSLIQSTLSLGLLVRESEGEK